MADQNPAAGMTSDEKAELERLRAEVADLEQKVATPAPRVKKARWRTVAASILILFGGLFIPISIASMWMTSQITDTNRYVQTIAPLANNPAIQDSVANSITNQIFKFVNVDQVTSDVFAQLGKHGILPPAIAQALQSFAGPVSSGIKNFIRDAVTKITHTKAFGVAWINANRIAHQSMVDALSGKTSGNVVIKDGTVSVNMAALVTTIKSELVKNGFGIASKIPNVNATFTILHSADLQKAQTAYKLLTPLTYVLPILAIIFLVAGAFLAKSRRRAVIGAGLVVAVSAGITALALAGARTAYLAAMPGIILDHNAAAVVFDSIFRYLKEGIRNTALIGLLFAIGAFLIGPASGSVAIRRWCVSGIASMRRGVEKLGLDLKGVSNTLAPIAKYLRIAAVVIAVVIFLLWTYRTPVVVLWIAFGLLVALGVIQFFVSPGIVKQEAVASDDSSGDPSALVSA